mgnify:CR=1 FL=1
MSTFVVRFVGARSDEWRGRAVHVRTGEEIRFVTIGELLEFFEGFRGLDEAAAPGARAARKAKRELRDADHLGSEQ